MLTRTLVVTHFKSLDNILQLSVVEKNSLPNLKSLEVDTSSHSVANQSEFIKFTTAG